MMKRLIFLSIFCSILLAGCGSGDIKDSGSAVTTLESTAVSVTEGSVSETTVVTSRADAVMTTTATADVTDKVSETTVTPAETQKTVKTKETEKTQTDVPAKTEAKSVTTTTTTKNPDSTTAATEAPKPKTTTTTTTAPKSEKILSSAFKQELVKYIQDYCKETGLVYRDDGNTPANSSWDIPIRTLYGESNDDIKERVRNRARIILINYGEGTVINLYFEDDPEAPGEWRIYVLF